MAESNNRDRTAFENAVKALEAQLANAGFHLTIDANTRLAYASACFASLRDVRGIRRFTWTLELLNRDVMSLPFSDPRGVSRPFSFRKRFRIHGRPFPNPEA